MKVSRLLRSALVIIPLLVTLLLLLVSPALAAEPPPPPFPTHPAFLYNRPLPDADASICLPPFMVQDPTSTHFWWARATGTRNLEITLFGIGVNEDERGQVVMDVVSPSGVLLGSRTLTQPASGEIMATPVVISGTTLGSLYMVKVHIIPGPSAPPARHYRLSLKGASLLGANTPLQAQAEHDNASWAVNVGTNENLNVVVQHGPEAPATTGSVIVRDPSGALVTTVSIDTLISIPSAAVGMWTVRVVNADGHYVITKTSGDDRGVYVTWTTWGFGHLSGSITRGNLPNTTPVTIRVTNSISGVSQDFAATSSYSVPEKSLPVGTYTVQLLTPGSVTPPPPRTIRVTCHGTYVVNFGGPVAMDDEYSTNEDTMLTVVAPGVLGNDFDPDGDTMTAVRVNPGPANGTLTLNGDGSFTYNPYPNFNGLDSFWYKVTDGALESLEPGNKVTITVNPVNDPPVAVDDTALTSVFTPVTVSVLANDSDIDGDSLTIVSVTQGGNGTVNSNGTSVTYTPNSDFSGIDSFTYTVSDGRGGTATATVTITVSIPTLANGKITAGVLRFGNNGRGGFNVQSDAKGIVKGELEYQNGPVNLHAKTMIAIAVSPDRTKGWFTGVLTDGRKFTAYVEDNGEPGNNDVFRLWVEGALQNGDGKLTGGNVQIHKS